LTDPAQPHAEARQDLRFAPGSSEGRKAFAALLAPLPQLFEAVFPNPQFPRAVIVVTGISLDTDLLVKVSGAPQKGNSIQGQRYLRKIDSGE
jgi:hypothetical protein